MLPLPNMPTALGIASRRAAPGLRVAGRWLCAAACTLAAAASPAATLSWQASSGLTPEQADARWALNYASSLPAPALDGGALTIATTSNTGEASYYSVAGSELALPTSGPAWLEVETRLLGGGGTNGWWRAPIFLAITFDNGNAASLEIAQDTAWLRDGNNSVGTQASGIDTDDAFHTWRLEVASDAPGALVTAYYDGAALMSAPAVFANPGGSNLGLMWGEGSILAWGSSEWRGVSTNLAAVSSVPEPALWLYSLVGGAGLCWRQRQRRGRLSAARMTA